MLFPVCCFNEMDTTKTKITTLSYFKGVMSCLELRKIVMIFQEETEYGSLELINFKYDNFQHYYTINPSNYSIFLDLVCFLIPQSLTF